MKKSFLGVIFVIPVLSASSLATMQSSCTSDSSALSASPALCVDKMCNDFVAACKNACRDSDFDTIKSECENIKFPMTNGAIAGVTLCSMATVLGVIMLFCPISEIGRAHV